MILRLQKRGRKCDGCDGRCYDTLTCNHRTFEKGFVTLSVFPLAWVFFPKIYRARELVAAAMFDYIRKEGYKTASGLVRSRFEHHVEQWGLGLEDFGRGELGNTFAVLGNSTPCALWLLFHILSDNDILADVRKEVSAMVRVNEEDGCNSIDLATVRTSCPILRAPSKKLYAPILSTQEYAGSLTMSFSAIRSSSRKAAFS